MAASWSQLGAQEGLPEVQKRVKIHQNSGSVAKERPRRAQTPSGAVLGASWARFWEDLAWVFGGRGEIFEDFRNALGIR